MARTNDTSGRRIPRATLGQRRDRPIDYRPDAAERAAIAAELDLVELRAARLAGRLEPQDRDGWDLDAKLTAIAVQSCRITLAPVLTQIDEPVLRRFRTGLAEPEPGTETEIPADDALEPLPDVVDLAAVLQEALALALPAFPEAPGAAFEGARLTEPGKAPLADEDLKPFAALSGLKKRLDGDG